MKLFINQIVKEIDMRILCASEFRNSARYFTEYCREPQFCWNSRGIDMFDTVDAAMQHCPSKAAEWFCRTKVTTTKKNKSQAAMTLRDEHGGGLRQQIVDGAATIPASPGAFSGRRTSGSPSRVVRGYFRGYRNPRSQDSHADQRFERGFESLPSTNL